MVVALALLRAREKAEQTLPEPDSAGEDGADR